MRVYAIVRIGWDKESKMSEDLNTKLALLDEASGQLEPFEVVSTVVTEDEMTFVVGREVVE